VSAALGSQRFQFLRWACSFCYTGPDMTIPTLLKTGAAALILAWLLLFFSSYGVLVRSNSTSPLDRAQGELERTVVSSFINADKPDTLQCTYFIATGFHTVEYWYSERQVCPRLRSYND
jgi:hypothetical protein